MALFRSSQSASVVQNWFWELPDHYWVGTMLVNKHTFLPVGGYDTPLVQLGPWSSPPTNFKAYIESQPWCCASMLGQFSPLMYPYFPSRFISPTNDMEKIPKSYYPDPDDQDIVYLLRTLTHPGASSFLTKYNVKTHTVEWDKKAIGSNLPVRVQIFGVENGFIYMLCQHNYYPTAVQMNFHSDTNYLFWSIVRVSTTDGNVAAPTQNTRLQSGAPSVYSTTNTYTFGDGNDCVYMGRLLNGKDLFLYFFLDCNGPYSASSVTNNQLRFRTGYFLYDRGSNKIEDVPNPLGTPIKWVGTESISYHVRGKLQSSAIMASKPSSPDKTFEGKIVSYGHWGQLLRYDSCGERKPEDIRQIWRFIYDPGSGTQTMEPLRVLNMEGTTMTVDDWNKFSGSWLEPKFAKFYVIYGDSSKKFLMVHEGNTNGEPSSLSSFYNDRKFTTYIFEFKDETTLQMVDRLDMCCICIMWLKNNMFLAGRSNRIRIYSIDKTTGKMKMVRSIAPSLSKGSFSFATIDDMQNIWVSEYGLDPLQNNQQTCCLYYFNSFTVYQLVMKPEHSTYVYKGSDIQTWIKISAVGDLGDSVARDVRMFGVGPMKFTTTGSKAITTKTLVGQEVQIPITLTGVGEVGITMSLTSE